MASIHDPLLHLLRDDPTPLLTLLRMAAPEATSLGPLPLQGWKASSEAFGRARFRERRPDLVLIHPECPIVLVFELQNRIDWRKLRTWPYYAATAGLRHNRDAVLVVFTLRRSVVTWARSLPSPPWCRLRLVVIGPDELRDDSTSPALAVLAALAGGDPQRVEHAVTILDRLDEAARMAYLDLLREHLSGRRVVALLESMMARKQREYPAYKKLIEEFSRMVGREEGTAQGLQQGTANTTRSLVADILRRLGRDAEISALETLDLPTLQQRLQSLLDECVPAHAG